MQILQRRQNGEALTRYNGDIVVAQLQMAQRNQPTKTVSSQPIAHHIIGQIQLEQRIHCWPRSSWNIRDPIVAQKQMIQRNRNVEDAAQLIVLDGNRTQATQFGERTTSHRSQSISIQMHFEQRWQRTKCSRFDVAQLIRGQIERTQRKQHLKDAAEYAGHIIVRQVDGVQLVQFRECVFRYVDDLIVWYIEEFQAGHIAQWHLKHERHEERTLFGANERKRLASGERLITAVMFSNWLYDNKKAVA